jgi:hypothetical protein
MDGWDGMAFDTPILISFNNNLSFDHHESTGYFVWPVFSSRFHPTIQSGLISSLACGDTPVSKHPLQTSYLQTQVK